jgi:hypothetical protein
VGDGFHGAVTRRPPISLDTMVIRTGGYAYDASVRESSIIQGPVSVAPCQTLRVTIRQLSSSLAGGVRLGRTHPHELARQPHGMFSFLPYSTG